MIVFRWLKKRWKETMVRFAIGVCFNLYFIILMQVTQIKYLLYLDLLLLVMVAIIEGTAFFDFYKKERRKAIFLQKEEPIYMYFDNMEDSAVFVHDLQVLEACVQKKYAENCDLQDFVAKWCHEFKIPLAAAFLIVEKLKDADARTDLREQLERMNWQMSMMMQGCRLQSPLFDLQVKSVSLSACVRTSIKNNQFFLIQKKFQMDVTVGNAYVYTDEVWLTYILDQILNNAVKYTRTNVAHKIHFWTECLLSEAFLSNSQSQETCKPHSTESLSSENIALYIEDNGEGIQACDIRRIFEKGFTGSNYHNGRYKSTGMGLYMANKIAERLEHKLSVESQYGEYTRFCIVFWRKEDV